MFRVAPTGKVFMTSWADGSLACYNTVPVVGADTTFIMQRDAVNMRLICDAFDNQTGALVDDEIAPITSPGVPNGAGTPVTVGNITGNIAYVRSFSTVVAPGSAPSNTCTGDLVDYELNGSGTDQAKNANLRMSGAAYVVTPTYDPIAIFNPWPTINTFRAGTSIRLDASNSFSATDNATLSYIWSQGSGPSVGSFSSTTSADPTFSASVPGTYEIHLVVTDSGGHSANVSTLIGAVVTDDSYVVRSVPEAINKLVGSLTMSGTSPWIYYDLAEIATGSNIAKNALANPPGRGAAYSGTVRLTNAPSTMIGTGTHFTTELTQGQAVIVAWDSVDGAGTGNYIANVQTINDDTHATLNYFQFYIPAPSAARIYAVPPETSTFSMNWWQNSNIGTFWTFYDLPLALYRLYYRTGISTYLTQARQIADYEWSWLEDHGYATPVPRGAGLLGQFLRALDGHSERLPPLYTLSSFLQGWQIGSYRVPALDLREAGYTLWFEAAGSMADTDPARHSWYCTNVTNNVNKFIAWQYPGGWWGEDVTNGNPGYPNAPLSYDPLVFGASPWRTSILIKALEASYDALNDTSSQGCNNTALAASLLTTITKAVDWQWSYGRDSSNRGIWYEVQYPNIDQGATFPPGTVSVKLGSNSVVGSSTSFTTAFSCNGTDYIGINAAKSSTVYRVVSCADDTHLTITPSYGSYGAPLTETSNAEGATMSRSLSASSNCADSLSSYCFTGAGTGDLNLDRLVPGDIAWLYKTTGNSIYRTYADEFFSAAFGGPASGPTSQYRIGQTYAGRGSGPNALGYIGDSIIGLPDCAAPNPAPCTPGGNVFANFGKNFDEAAGAPGADNALAWRIIETMNFAHGTVSGQTATQGSVKIQ
jgi:hypothetical protein